MKQRVLINGAMGHMGKAILTAMEDGTGDLVPAAGVDLQAGEYPVPLFASAQAVDVPFDVAIDFSRPAATMAVMELCLREGKPLVTGTTGLGEEEMMRLKAASRIIPVFYSRNMSLGVNLQLALVQAATKVLGDAFDPEIVETHHNLKVDAPSGTALMLAEAIEHARSGESELVFGRHEKNKRRAKEEIGIHSLRGGNKAGEHTVYFLGDDEELIITHRAGSKRVFAQGALKAAAFLVRQRPGFYTMADVVCI
ncbi:MAG: 4-hydroxy-tetrahydrodipicolinate reductase [Clostridia bacterium]|nr:4-hydroxy-tetrahydrodipicolinate reductase [Clostridia bacterium]